MCKLERVLQGDPDEDTDLYLKPKQRTEGETKALSKKVKAAAIHLSDFRQPFAWGMQQLFTDTVCADAVLCCAVLCCAAVLCYAVLYCAVLCCAVLCCAVLCCAVSCVLCAMPL